MTLIPAEHWTQKGGGKGALGFAERLKGKPYVWGGNFPPLGPDNGTDCSGLVQWGYFHVGIELPRVTYEQYLIRQVGMDAEPEAGDLWFFAGSDPGPNGEPGHVGFYVGKGLVSPDQLRFIETARGRDVVFNAPWTGDPHGIRYDYVTSIGEPTYKTRPALLLPPAP